MIQHEKTNLCVKFVFIEHTLWVKLLSKFEKLFKLLLLTDYVVHSTNKFIWSFNAIKYIFRLVLCKSFAEHHFSFLINLHLL